MKYEDVLHEVSPIAIGIAGARRYGYEASESDIDYFILSKDEDKHSQDIENKIDFFVVSIDTVKSLWGHPVFIGDLTGKCDGNECLCSFLFSHRRKIAYTAPEKTVSLGLEHIAMGERYGFKSPIKTGLRTAMILSHMAEEREDPFVLSDEEKAVLIRARTGDVPSEERVEIYRRTICPANLDKLRRMPENTKVRDELFALVDEICKEEST